MKKLLIAAAAVACAVAAQAATFDWTTAKAYSIAADTIAGGLAGLFYGYDTIPEDWLAAIQRREWIEGLCEGK